MGQVCSCCLMWFTLTVVLMLSGCGGKTDDVEPLAVPMPTLTLTVPKAEYCGMLTRSVDDIFSEPDHLETFTLEGVVYPPDGRELYDITEPVPDVLVKQLVKREKSYGKDDYFSLMAVVKAGSGYAALVNHHFKPKNDDPAVIRRVYYYQKQWMGMGLSQRPNKTVIPVPALHRCKTLPHSWIRRILTDAQQTTAIQ